MATRTTQPPVGLRNAQNNNRPGNARSKVKPKAKKSDVWVPTYTVPSSLPCFTEGNYLAIDTEATGHRYQKSPYAPVDYPYILSACDAEGHTYYWETKVDPFTRVAKWNKQDINQIKELLSDYSSWVFHNAPFDVRGLVQMGVFTSEQLNSLWPRIHCSLSASHVLDSAEPHGLKPLCEKYLGISTADEHFLQELTIACRSLAKAKGYTTYDVVNHDNTSQKPDAFFIRIFEKELINRGLLKKGQDPLRTYAVTDVERASLLWDMQRKALLKIETPVPDSSCYPYRCDADGVCRTSLAYVYLRERDNLLPTYRIEETGIHVFTDECEKSRHDALVTVNRCRESLEEVAQEHGIDSLMAEKTFSPKKLQNLLFDQLELPVVGTTKKGNPSLDKNAMEIYGTMLEAGQLDPNVKPVIENLVAHNKAYTAVSYVSSYLDHAIEIPPHADLWCDYDLPLHRLYPNLNPRGTRTTRFAHYDPNTANIGKRGIKLRHNFGPPPGFWWYAIDYSQLELRIVAVAANERVMLAAFENNEDIHLLTAAAVYNLPPEKITPLQRFAAKAVNFGIIYGMGVAKCERITGVPGFKEAFRNRYPDLAIHMNRIISFATKHGYVNTLGGYRLMVDPGAEYAGLDYQVQGSAGDVMKFAMNQIYAYITYLPKSIPEWQRPRMIMTIHDELVFEVSKACPLFVMKEIAKIMTNAGRYIGVHTPVEVSRTDKDWSKVRKMNASLTRYMKD